MGLKSSFVQNVVMALSVPFSFSNPVQGDFGMLS